MNISRNRHRIHIIALALGTLLAGSPVAEAQATAAGARLTPRELGQLRWITGDWIGSGVEGTEQPAFYERYRFENDSTLLVQTYADSTFTTATEDARFELRFGRLSNTGKGNRWVAVHLDALGVEFGPASNTKSTIKWARALDGDDTREWRATLSYVDKAGAATEKRFRMQRIR